MPLVELLKMSFLKVSMVSGMPLFFWVYVSAPLMPDVAFVELPPQNGFLSISTTLPPLSRTVCTADRPARPPPITIVYVYCIL